MSGRALLAAPWAIEPAVLRRLEAFYQSGHETSAASPGGGGRAGRMVKRGEVAVIPVSGVLMKSPGLLDMLFGASSTTDIASDIEGALADPEVKGILLDTNSPGGTVAGTQELARRVHQASKKKPLAALANEHMTSAAYWIGAAAGSVWVSSDTAIVGSIGVIGMHIDISEREKMLGVKVSEIVAGRQKAYGSPHAPLSAEARDSLQAQIDHLYGVFVGDVALFRGVPASTVLSQMADARLFIGKQAIAAGLVDGTATLQELSAGLVAGAFRRGAVQASALARNQAGIKQPEEVWRSDRQLRAEFGGNYSAYAAWHRMEAAGRIINQRK